MAVDSEDGTAAFCRASCCAVVRAEEDGVALSLSDTMAISIAIAAVTMVIATRSGTCMPKTDTGRLLLLKGSSVTIQRSEPVARCHFLRRIGGICLLTGKLAS